MDPTDDKGSVLITGGSGLLGKYLTSTLLSAGYRVSHLSRNSNQFGKVRVFRWDPAKGILDPVILDGIEYIIHLAGANIGEKRWTAGRKDEILRSRTGSARLLYDTVSSYNLKLKAYISASAVGYYGSFTSEQILTEEHPPSDDFLGKTCRLWEEAADMFLTTGARVVKIRTAVVLEKTDSALSRMLIPARYGIFPTLGSGLQYMPWIHPEDLCNIYLKALSDKSLSGVYNAVAPQHVTQKEFMQHLAGVLRKRYFHPPVPAFFLRLVFGQMAGVVLNGSRISPEKILSAGYTFKNPDLKETLARILI